MADRLAALATALALLAAPAAAHHGERGPHPDPRPVLHGSARAAPARPDAKAPEPGTRGPERGSRQGTRLDAGSKR